MTLQELNQQGGIESPLPQTVRQRKCWTHYELRLAPEHKIYLVCPTRRALGTRSEISPWRLRI